MSARNFITSALIQPTEPLESSANALACPLLATCPPSPKATILERNGSVSKRYRNMKAAKRSPVRRTIPSPPTAVAATATIPTTASRNAMKAISLISKRTVLSKQQHLAVNIGKTDALFFALKQEVVVDVRKSNNTRADGSPYLQREQRAPSKTLLRYNRPETSSKSGSQSHTLTRSQDKDLSCNEKELDAMQKPLDRTVGVGESTAWLSPRTIQSRGESDDERDNSQQPSVLNLAKAHTSKGSKFTRLRNLKNKAPAIATEVQPANKTCKLDFELASVVNNTNIFKLEQILDAASITFLEKNVSSNCSGASPRSLLSHAPLGGVAVRALQRANVQKDSRKKRLQDIQVQQVLKLKRGQYQNEKEAVHFGDQPSSGSVTFDEAQSLLSATPTYKQLTTVASGSDIILPVLQVGLLAKLSSTSDSREHPQGFRNKRTTRAERYAALKQKAEQRVDIQLSSTSSSDVDYQSIYPVHGFAKNLATVPALFGSHSRGSDSIQDALSNDLTSLSTKSSEGGPRASRLAAIRSAKSLYRASLSYVRQPIETTQEITQLELHYTPRGSTTVIPTFDDSLEQSYQPEIAPTIVRRNRMQMQSPNSKLTADKLYAPFDSDTKLEFDDAATHPDSLRRYVRESKALTGAAVASSILQEEEFATKDLYDNEISSPTKPEILLTKSEHSSIENDYAADLVNNLFGRPEPGDSSHMENKPTEEMLMNSLGFAMDTVQDACQADLSREYTKV
ncbi:hypothetical protein MPSEU_000426200 [Mayamaea pseudoterrestris]|nr:hypothetical protein MPSEU_000426200 [Mayamaea pseudoterrestris]